MPGWFAKIDRRMWGDAKFRQLSPMPCSGQALWIWLLTGGSNFGPAGLLHLGALGIADKTKWPVTDIQQSLQELQDLDMIFMDENTSTILIRKAIDYNPPYNSNTVKGWLKSADLIPEGPLVNEWKCILSNHLEEKEWWKQTGIEIRFETPIEPLKIKIKIKNKSKEGAKNAEELVAGKPAPGGVEVNKGREEEWEKWREDFAQRVLSEEKLPPDITKHLLDAYVESVNEFYAARGGKFTPSKKVNIAKRLTKFRPGLVLIALEIFIDQHTGRADERYVWGICNGKKHLSEAALGSVLDRHRAGMQGRGIAAEMGVKRC